MDKETHDKIKEKTGISATNGINLMRAIICLLNMYDAQEDDDVSAIRNGGFGSTSKRKGCDV